MKSSFEQLSIFTMAWKRGTLRSTSCARRQLLLARRLQHLHAVLVGAGEEEHVMAVEPHEAGDGIGGDRFVGVADMRRAVRIGNRGGDVIGLASHLILAPQLGALTGGALQVAAPQMTKGRDKPGQGWG